MMRRFAKINPGTLSKIPAKEIDQRALKVAWIEMADYAEAEMNRLADTQPKMPIGVAFEDQKGKPGWIGSDSSLTIHHPCMGGCLPKVQLNT